MNTIEDSVNTSDKILLKYKFVSIVLAAVFAIVGIIFLFLSQNVITFFNYISIKLGFLESHENISVFHVALSVAYMYLVTLLAFMMFLKPKNRQYLFLLINGKSASSILSLYFFITYKPYLILLTNFIVDSVIAIFLLVFYLKLKEIF